MVDHEKRNVLLLVILSILAYGAYLLWLYLSSGGSMTVSYEMPGWTFPIFVGAFIFALAFGGGFAGLALTNPDLAGERCIVFQLLLFSVILALVSSVVAFWRMGFISFPETLVFLTAALLPVILLARKRRDRFTPNAPVTDERDELIELKSRALAGDVLLTVLAFGYLALSFGLKPWTDVRTTLFALMTLYMVTWIAARFHYRRVS